MKKYWFTMAVPFEAVDDRAAAAAQSDLFDQVRNAIGFGYVTRNYRIRPIRDVEFTELTRVMTRQDKEKGN